ncbi:MAG: SHD1 domain-containing protein [Rubripirellula sp.]
MRNISLGHTVHLRRMLVLPLIAGLGFLSPAQAEIWTDTTGSFKIDAEYERVDGASVVLRKTDGQTITVPINRLSEASRARAKELYEKAKSGGSPSTTNTAPNTSNYQPANRFANIVAPSPPDIGQMAPFPSEPKLQQQFDYMKAQVMNGHLEVFWYSLPDDVRTQLDSQEFRDLYRPMLKNYADQNAPMEKITAKLLEVLTTKKEFVLGSSLLASVPPGVLPMLQQGYDPGVGLMYEWMSLSKGFESIPDTTFTELANYHLPRLGAHAKELLPLAPAGSVDGLLGQVVIEQTSATTGTITTPKQNGETETVELVLHDGRWLPSEFVELLIANKDNLVQKAKESATEFEKVMSPASQAQTAALLETVSVPVNAALDSLLAATNQQEFDQAAMGMVQQVMMMAAAGMGGGNAAPAGPPAGF